MISLNFWQQAIATHVAGIHMRFPQINFYGITWKKTNVGTDHQMRRFHCVPIHSKVHIYQLVCSDTMNNNNTILVLPLRYDYCWVQIFGAH